VNITFLRSAKDKQIKILVNRYVNRYDDDAP